MSVSIEYLASDLSFAAEAGSELGYGAVSFDETGDYIPVEEYSDDGEISARYKLRVVFEKEEK